MDIEILNDPFTSSNGVMSGFSVYSCSNAAELMGESDEDCQTVSDKQLADFMITSKVVTRYFDPTKHADKHEEIEQVYMTDVGQIAQLHERQQTVI